MKRHLILAAAGLLLAIPLFFGPVAAEEKTDGMVYIAGGAFIKGADAGDRPTNDSPKHPENVKSFWIDRYEVTNAEFEEFIAAGGYGKKQFWTEEGFAWVKSTKRTLPDDWEKRKELLGDDFGKHPVTGVSWFDADAFARFCGKRLPTETEWERASRGTDGRTYPWGNDLAVGYKVPPSGDRSATDPIGSNPADVSADGVFDMGASVSEWTSSWFEPYPGTKYQSRYWGEDARARLKVARGGSWRSVARGEKTAAVQCQTTYREIQYSWRRGHPFIGFRLAMDAKPVPADTDEATEERDAEKGPAKEAGERPDPEEDE